MWSQSSHLNQSRLLLGLTDGTGEQRLPLHFGQHSPLSPEGTGWDWGTS